MIRPNISDDFQSIVNYSREEAINKAEKLLEDMSVSDMESLSDYLQDSEEIDEEGLVLDENDNIIDE